MSLARQILQIDATATKQEFSDSIAPENVTVGTSLQIDGSLVDNAVSSGVNGNVLSKSGGQVLWVAPAVTNYGAVSIQINAAQAMNPAVATDLALTQLFNTTGGDIVVGATSVTFNSLGTYHMSLSIGVDPTNPYGAGSSNIRLSTGVPTIAEIHFEAGVLGGSVFFFGSLAAATALTVRTLRIIAPVLDNPLTTFYSESRLVITRLS